MRIWLSFIVLPIIFFPKIALSCICSDTSSEEQKNLIENAYFIGVLKITEQNSLNQEDYKVAAGEMPLPLSQAYSVAQIQAYKGNITDNDRILSSQSVDCSMEAPKVNQIYKRVIKKQGDKLLLLNTKCEIFSEEVWKQLEEKSRKTPELIQIETECKNQGGIWEYVNYTGVCSLTTQKEK